MKVNGQVSTALHWQRHASSRPGNLISFSHALPCLVRESFNNEIKPPEPTLHDAASTERPTAAHSPSYGSPLYGNGHVEGFHANVQVQ